MQFSQFYAAPLYVNPAFTGTTVEHRMAANSRLQWPSIPGGFKAYHFSYDYNAADINSGFGLMANREESGSFGLTTNLIALSYAYRFEIKRELFVMGGVKFGYAFRSLDYSKLVFNDQLESESPVTRDTEAFADQNINYPDISAGVLLYSPQYWFGMSLNHLNEPNQTLLSGNNTISELPMKFSMHGGYVFSIKDKIVNRATAQNVTVAFQYKSQGKFDQLDLGFYYNNSPLVFGLWYRGLPLIKHYEPTYANNDAIVALVGYSIPDYNISIGYSYDITISRLISNSGGSHEISLIYEVASRRKKRRNRKFIVPCAKF
jgi:type IX secretion system PorP/SprF family membrane protein